MWSKIRAWFEREEQGNTRIDRRRIQLSFEEAPLVYAIGDLHGAFDEFLIAEARIKNDLQSFSRKALVILLGDLVDRGPHSAQLLDYLVSSRPKEFHRIAICGNHDSAFLDFTMCPRDNMAWLDYGGRETLRSYGIDIQYLIAHGGVEALTTAVESAVPSEHINLLKSLPISVQIDDVLFVHAGIAPGVPLSEQRQEDFMWIRAPFLELGPGLPITVVHGHTPVTDPYFGNGRIGIDTGAYATGRLTVLRFWQGEPELI